MERLVAEKIKAAMSSESQSLLSQIQIVPTINSTNTFLIAHCKEYEKGFVLFAEEQTAGRGRQGKSWVSPKNENIYASLLWYLPTQSSLAPLGLAVAVMLVQALEVAGLTTGLQMKWPNDIYFQGRKLAGILIESVPLNPETYVIVVGFGLNVSEVDDKELANKAISLSEIEPDLGSRNALAGKLIDAILIGLSRYHASGFNKFIEAWQRYDMLQGKSVVVHTSQFSLPGIALGVNMKGELLLRDEYGKEHAFHSGEVSVMLS